MATRSASLVRPAIVRRLERLLPPRPPVLATLERAARAAGEVVVEPEVARLLELLAAAAPAGRVLELGAGPGYATVHLARGCREGRVVAVDRDAAALARVRASLAAAGVAERVDLVAGEARQVIEEANGPFDLVVIDVDGREARRLIDLALPKMKVGGRLVILGALRGELTPETGGASEAEREELDRMLPYLLIHPQLAAMLLPLGGGVGFAVKLRPTIREMGGPF